MNTKAIMNAKAAVVLFSLILAACGGGSSDGRAVRLLDRCLLSFYQLLYLLASRQFSSFVIWLTFY